MKNSPIRLLAVVFGSFGTLVAAPLAEKATVYARPDASSTAVAELAAGTEPVTATTGYGVLPSGWIAVTLAGPHEVFVQNKDITKSLDVAAGAAMHREPTIESPVLAVAAEGDLTEITGLRGRWTQILLNKPLIGYVRVGPAPAPATAADAAPAAATPAPTAGSQAQKAAPPPTATPIPAPPAAAPAGQPAPTATEGGGSSALPRLFEGRFVSTRAPLRPRRPYDFQLSAENGERYAYLDLSKLLLTEQIESYLDRPVTVYGAVGPVPGTKDIVIIVESMKLR